MPTTKLWNKNFTIITLGTVISMLGNTLSNFSLGLLVFDYTQSTFSYALYLICYSLPRIIMPTLAGPYLDKHSRLKVIYVLDFSSSFLFLLIFLLLYSGFYSFSLFIAIALILGTTDSIYSVAYDSLYPNLISKDHFSKAYSISSMIYPLATMTLPLAAFLHEKYGVTFIFLFNALSFLIAACFETKIEIDETQIQSSYSEEKSSYINQFKEGLSYIKLNPGLMVIVIYFFTNSMLQTSISQTLEMPYLKENINFGIQFYSFVSVLNVLGRFIGGMIHYRFKLPSHLKYTIALNVYYIITILNGIFLFLPKSLILVSSFLIGLLSVTSFNIRISSTQNYVSNSIRGRFNGVFLTITTIGSIIGQLISGALGDIYDTRIILLVCNIIVFMATYVIVDLNKKYLKPIYNSKI